MHTWNNSEFEIHGFFFQLFFEWAYLCELVMFNAIVCHYFVTKALLEYVESKVKETNIGVATMERV